MLCNQDPPEQWYLLHDGDKKFKSGVVLQWLHNNGVTVLDWPSYSPDLNPIENLWACMQRDVDTHGAETLEELEKAVRAEWILLAENKELLRKLAHSMPRRCAAVVAAKGWHTKY